jgi:peptidoglycan/xylan/chitin deacetylase (PgdA/CDA1 family)
MTDPFRDDYSYLTELPPELRDRRQAAARRRRWRRRLAVVGLLAVVGAVVALAVATIGGGGSDGGTGAQPPSRTGAAPPSYPASWAPHPGPVPILEYHAIQPPVPGQLAQLFVPQADFQRQMQWLKDQGYEAVTLDQVEAAWYRQGELPPKPIVVSFDDGYLSQYVAAFPALEHFHWPGVLNLVAKNSDLPDADVQKMLDANPPWELASHTITHADLTTLGSPDLDREVVGSRRMLQGRFDVPVNNFSYPEGRYDDTVIAAVKAAGYRGAMSEVPGAATAAHPYVLNRIEIEIDDGLSGFISKLKAAESGASTADTPSPGG